MPCKVVVVLLSPINILAISLADLAKFCNMLFLCLLLVFTSKVSLLGIPLDIEVTLVKEFIPLSKLLIIVSLKLVILSLSSSLASSKSSSLETFLSFTVNSLFVCISDIVSGLANS